MASGDLQLVGMQEVDGHFVFDYNRVFDVVDVPFVKSKRIKALPVCQRVCALREPNEKDEYEGAALERG